MVQIFSFKAFRPPAAEAQQIASVPPYDVVSTEESRAALAENPQSFLQVIRSEATLPADTDPAAPVVYETAAANLHKLIDEGLLLQDAEPGIYLYRVKQGGSIYTGFVANVSVDDYRDNKIKRHEHTRYDKEEDRTRHIDTTDMHTGLVVLLYRDPPGEIFPPILPPLFRKVCPTVSQRATVRFMRSSALLTRRPSARCRRCLQALMPSILQTATTVPNHPSI